LRRWLAQSRRKFVVVLVVLRWSLRWGWRGLAGGALGLQLLELRCKRLCTACRGWLSQLLLGLFFGLASAAALTSAVVAALALRRAVRGVVATLGLRALVAKGPPVGVEAGHEAEICYVAHSDAVLAALLDARAETIGAALLLAPPDRQD